MYNILLELFCKGNSDIYIIVYYCITSTYQEVTLILLWYNFCTNFNVLSCHNTVGQYKRRPKKTIWNGLNFSVARFCSNLPYNGLFLNPNIFIKYNITLYRRAREGKCQREIHMSRQVFRLFISKSLEQYSCHVSAGWGLQQTTLALGSGKTRGQGSFGPLKDCTLDPFD